MYISGMVSFGLGRLDTLNWDTWWHSINLCFLASLLPNWWALVISWKKESLCIPNCRLERSLTYLPELSLLCFSPSSLDRVLIIFLQGSTATLVGVVPLWPEYLRFSCSFLASSARVRADWTFSSLVLYYFAMSLSMMISLSLSTCCSLTVAYSLGVVNSSHWI